VRNIGVKAQVLTAALEHEKKLLAQHDKNQNDGKKSPIREWNNFIQQDFVRSKSSGSIGQLPPIKELVDHPSRKVNKKKFDSSRLLHPWQRYLEELKKGTALDEQREADAMERAENASPRSIKPNDVLLKSHQIADNNSHPKDDMSELSKLRNITIKKASEVGSLPQGQHLPVRNKNNKIIVSSTFAPKSEKSKSPMGKENSTSISKGVHSQISVKDEISGHNEDDGDDNDDDYDDGIGWSPFVIPNS
jgi:hypothetical protein